MEEVELGEYIRYVKDEIKKSEDPRPEEGFWIGIQSAEITFQTTTEITKGGGLKILFLSGEASKKDQSIQTVTMTFVSQDFKQIQASTGPGLFRPRRD